MKTAYDVKAKLFSFNDLSKSDGIPIDRETFIDLLNGQEYNQDLARGHLLGLFTHSGREQARSGKIPHYDSIAKDPDLTNKLVKIEVIGDDVIGYFQLVPGKASERLKKLFKMGTRIGVSISTALKRGFDSLKIVKLYGVDFTLRPDLNGEILSVNFSEKENGISDIQFVLEEVEFSDGRTFDLESDDEDIIINGDFSIRNFLMERKKKPAAILRKRIEELIQFLNASSAAEIAKNQDNLVTYIQSYIYDWMMGQLNDPTKRFNLAMNLRVNRYVSDRQTVRELQKELNRAEQKLRSTGALDKQSQMRLNNAYQKMIHSIIDYINSKVDAQNKQLLIGAKAKRTIGVAK